MIYFSYKCFWFFRNVSCVRWHYCIHLWYFSPSSWVLYLCIQSHLTQMQHPVFCHSCISSLYFHNLLHSFVLHYHHYLCNLFLHFSLHHHNGMDSLFSFIYTFTITVTTCFFVFIRAIITAWLTHFFTFIYITSLETSKSSFRNSDRLYFLLFVCFYNVVTTFMVTYFHY